MRRETFNFYPPPWLWVQNLNFPIQQLNPDQALQVWIPLPRSLNFRQHNVPVRETQDTMFLFWFFGVRLTNPEGWSGYPDTLVVLTCPLPTGTFESMIFLISKVGYVSSLEGRTWYHCVAMILKLFVPDPLWGRLVYCFVLCFYQWCPALTVYP